MEKVSSAMFAKDRQSRPLEIEVLGFYLQLTFCLVAIPFLLYLSTTVNGQIPTLPGHPIQTSKKNNWNPLPLEVS